MSIFDLYDILDKDTPSKYIKEREEEVFELIPDLKRCKDFDKTSDNDYKIYNTTLNVIDKLPNDLVLRLSGLFEYTGMPYCFSKDKDGNSFYKYNIISCGLFDKFATKFNVKNDVKNKVVTLIQYHNYNFDLNKEEDRDIIFNRFDRNSSDMLYKLKEANIKAYYESKLNKTNVYDKVK